MSPQVARTERAWKSRGNGLPLLDRDNLQASVALGESRRLIEEAGCSIFFLPTDSPDFNPIELAWSKLKTFLRQQQARSREALNLAITHGLNLISPQDGVSSENGIYCTLKR